MALLVDTDMFFFYIKHLICFFCAALFIIPAGAKQPAGIRYRVYISGVDDNGLRSDLMSVSLAAEMRKRLPASELQLRRRAEKDVPRFQKMLRSRGYYMAKVDIDIQAEQTTVRVYYNVNTGPRYVLRDIKFVSITDTFDAYEPNFMMIGLIPGAPADALAILKAEKSIVYDLESQGYPFARVCKRDVYVEHSSRSVDVIYSYEAGPKAVFGDTCVNGLDSVRESFVLGKLPWRQGDPYDGRLIRTAHRRLLDTDLFSSAHIIKSEELLDDVLSLKIELAERKQRSIGFGAGYASDEGARGRISWEHRNIFKHGERLTLSCLLSEVGYGSEICFQKPDFRSVNQTLKMDIRAALDEPDAFRSKNIGSVLGLDRELAHGLIIGGGAGFRYADVDAASGRNRFGLLYLPMYVNWDLSDDLLNPRRGGRFFLGAAPYHDVMDSSITFFKWRVGTSCYLPLTRTPSLGLAVRVVIASITGAVRDDVPADERYYAGGGGSVRGYAYQSAGPHVDGMPVGGNSMILTSSELRWRANRHFGLAFFMDGGTVYESSMPDAMDEFFWGAGAGIRYFTPVGPLRFDIAFPLDRRTELDDSYQIYISLGQAF